ncbi:hypothetical protein N7519_000335 [Penicillium mononematosum]|uniref:uncharacterized protein n=1 Tax=Penicillium mononematosum TaxID=268346 RepID=UPI002548F679|nr:uncharacterized protein N7519_000335 [Penicillium mononematosum]KAJ6190314.1 hypothetical protein N7519_000335 [Penicillium mononematosum]
MCHAPQGEDSLLRVTGRDLSLPADRVSQSPLEHPWLCLNEFVEGRRQTVHPAGEKPPGVLVRVARSFALTRFRPSVFHGAPERRTQPPAPPVVFPLAAERHLIYFHLSRAVFDIFLIQVPWRLAISEGV